ncbi:cytochrome c553 [Vibrio crassostreae]|uniref:Cytochrome c domain-containing protein n=1 Tax=Vibrio crassostreae TaxID=246167 RepID=A0ABP1X6R1_9VIBR|nr:MULTISPECIES: cytochrome c [Vibrio]NOH73746.1 cytochrome c [Vibrio crassostreae]NOI51980.1 cytochrome c [Vibrio crassostreae]PMI20619.1 cytochrome C554 [Vibrio sp. 10N.286.46.E10]PMI92459.1 cytochrome C554 [Vibrio sp. 10N.286.45.E10]PTP06451.1 cytochrome C554 [Vibrio sp. 10N.286.45.A3]
MSLYKRKFNPMTTLSTLVMTLVMFPVSAEVDQEQFELGKQKAKVCMTCHGVDGISTQDPYPNLRGQKVGYLISSLKDYQTRERTSGLAILMQQQADTLSDQDIRDISYFYSMLGNDSSEIGDSN